MRACFHEIVTQLKAAAERFLPQTGLSWLGAIVPSVPLVRRWNKNRVLDLMIRSVNVRCAR